MPRPRTLSDETILDAALEIVQREGPERITFAAVADACGLSPSTLVQRFTSKSGLLQAALLRAWDQIEALTASLAASTARTPAGAVEFLVGLSGEVDDVDSYADSLRLLREDFRDPVLRERGKHWGEELARILDSCFERVAAAPEGIGQLLMAQWQGVLIWWGFSPQGRLKEAVRHQLRECLDAVLGEPDVSDPG
ncbi:TetR family transcriptional regulator [Alkalilimnicola ehrlichii]|uniref:TetR family transcriptional regulator n=1 Tax=Alkalilimnicola ehrlichii TaxID=351052 RepID=A0A3E0X0H3_9GAMM|nr:TetR/AcrR family transcriptional regulator [Alkalilimnicola ehrlichii]RFA30969.1 TetR family transcriptional regulator [Alkalilimnicola ehrlichii]RFA38920.1 TetR family transcriptional regulator [Alkalilimnicola ehrlichii]